MLYWHYIPSEFLNGPQRRVSDSDFIDTTTMPVLSPPCEVRYKLGCAPRKNISQVIGSAAVSCSKRPYPLAHGNHCNPYHTGHPSLVFQEYSPLPEPPA